MKDDDPSSHLCTRLKFSKLVDFIPNGQFEGSFIAVGSAMLLQTFGRHEANCANFTFNGSSFAVTLILTGVSFQTARCLEAN